MFCVTTVDFFVEADRKQMLIPPPETIGEIVQLYSDLGFDNKACGGREMGRRPESTLTRAEAAPLESKTNRQTKKPECRSSTWCVLCKACFLDDCQFGLNCCGGRQGGSGGRLQLQGDRGALS